MVRVYIVFCFLLLGLSFYSVNGNECEVIVIDVGHGGRDPGANTLGIKESDLNLRMALTLRDVLEDDYRVILTREEDIDLCPDKFIKSLDMNTRCDIINSSGAILMISIHMNMFSNPKYSGAQVFYSNAVKGSSTLAGCIMTSLRTTMKNTSRAEVMRDNIYLLNRVCIPAVIVECGFMSNPIELENLCDPTYQHLLSLAIKGGINEYKKETESSVS